MSTPPPDPSLPPATSVPEAVDPDGVDAPDRPLVERQFESGGREWIARLAGQGACGTGGYALALLDAVHFYDAAAPERPIAEVLLARGRFAGLFDPELVELLARATPIVVPDER